MHMRLDTILRFYFLPPPPLFFVVFFFNFVFVSLRTHIIVGEIEVSKAGQASINVLGRRVIFKTLGTTAVIKAFDLF